jgi:hypothetical protein
VGWWVFVDEGSLVGSFSSVVKWLDCVDILSQVHYGCGVYMVGFVDRYDLDHVELSRMILALSHVGLWIFGVCGLGHSDQPQLCIEKIADK